MKLWRISFYAFRENVYIPRYHTLQLHKMQKLTFEQSRYLKLNETIETELAKHIPVVDVALIIADYAISISPFMCNAFGICDHCNRKHRRTSSNLCMDCRNLCFMCKRTTCSEKVFICFYCLGTRKDYEVRPYMMMSGSKCQMYRSLFNVRFPSDVHVRVVAEQKRNEAARAEAKKLEAEFNAREAAKSMCDRYIECRAKLWKLQELVNEAKRTHTTINLPAQPVFPYY